jgi:hypothetical protein
MMQLWDVQTIQNPANPGKDIRNDISFRRARFGVKGKIRKYLSYSVIFAYDGIGRDKYSAANGSPE